MSRYSVRLERCQKKGGARSGWYEYVDASSESQARSIAREKAKIRYPGQTIAVLEAKKIG